MYSKRRMRFVHSCLIYGRQLLPLLRHLRHKSQNDSQGWEVCYIMKRETSDVNSSSKGATLRTAGICALNKPLFQFQFSHKLTYNSPIPNQVKFF